MTKNEAIRIISSCAKEYHDLLENKNMLFIFGGDHNLQYMETLFLPRHFLHLTGVNTSLKSSEFYNLVLKGGLSPKAFEFTQNGTTEMKLSVLPRLIKLHKTAKMIGEYNDSKSLLLTEKLAGNTAACLGFVQDEKTSLYIPNTALREDIRDITRKPQLRVLSIFRKNVAESVYMEECYRGKGVQEFESKLSSELKAKIAKPVESQTPPKSLEQKLVEAREKCERFNRTLDQLDQSKDQNPER